MSDAPGSLLPHRRISRWLDALVADWVTVYRWNPRLYRRVSTSGMVLGFALAALLALVGFMLAWTVAAR